MRPRTVSRRKPVSALQTHSAALAQSTWTKISFGTALLNADGSFDTANSRWVCQESGIYLLAASVAWSIQASAPGMLVSLYKNGSSWRNVGAATVNTGVNPGAIVQGVTEGWINAGEYIEVWGYCSAASVALSGDHGRFSARKAL